MALTPEDVMNQKFTITKFRDGYDLDQVDDFLDTIVEELRRHEQDKATLQAQVDDLAAKLADCEARAEGFDGDVSEQTIVVDAPAPVTAAPAAEPAVDEGGARPDAVKSSAMLQLALELHDKYVREGETTRDRLISEGERKNKELIEDGEQKRAEELDRLARERSEVEDHVKELRSFESEYRTTLRSYIQSQLRSLDGSPEPAGAPEGLQ